jgi:hypothetical protein
LLCHLPCDGAIGTSASEVQIHDPDSLSRE